MKLPTILFILLKVAEFSQNFVGKFNVSYNGKTNKKIEETMTQTDNVIKALLLCNRKYGLLQSNVINFIFFLFILNNQ